MSTSGGYREYIGGCSVHWGFQYKSKADRSGVVKHLDRLEHTLNSGEFRPGSP